MIMSTFTRAMQTARRILRRDGLLSLLGVIIGHLAGKVRHAWHRKRSKRSLQEHLDSTAFIILSTVEWDFPYKQRPQHLASALGQQGVPCLYFAPFYSLASAIPGSEVDQNVFIYYEESDLIGYLNDAHTIVVLSTDNTLTVDFVEQLKTSGATIIYDYIDMVDDAISLQDINDNRRLLHRDLLRDPEVICIASADTLYKEALAMRTDRLSLVTNGVDYEAFADVRRGDRRAPELVAVPRDRLIVGYHGALAAWLDYELIDETARIRHDTAFVLIGPDYDGSSRAWRGSMTDNVFFLPPVDFRRIPQVSVWFDVCMVPFTRTPLTDAVSPLKLFEYLALGKPVIATDFAEVRKYAPVLTVHSAGEFAAAIGRGRSLSRDKTYIEECKAIARANSWETKAQDLIEIAGSRPGRTSTIQSQSI